MTNCVLQLPLEAGNQQWGHVPDRHQLIGHVALPLSLVSLMPAPGALTNVTLVRVRFGYTGLRAQWSSHGVVYQLFGQAVASLQDRFARDRVFPLEEGSVYYLPSEFFSRAQLSLAPVTTGSLTLLLTVLNPVTLRRLLHKVRGPVHGSLRNFQMALSSLQALESDPQPKTQVSVAMPTGFDLLTLNVEHTVKTKVMALRQLLQWSEYPAVVLLQETGILPPRFVFHCLCCHTFTVVSSSSAGVAILFRRDSQLHIGDFVHHLEGRAIVLELVPKGTPVQVVNAYMSAEGTAKEYRPLLQWLRAHVAPDSQLVLMGGDFQCNPGWSADCVSVNTEIAPVLSEFAADMTLLPFTHGMSGRTWVSAQSFVGALDFFLSRRVPPEIGTVRVENESVFSSDPYPVRLCLHTLPALVPPGNPASKARFNLGTSVCKWQQETFADSCTGLRSLPPATTPEAY